MPAPSFADVLDEALARAREQVLRTAVSSSARLRDGTNPFLYARPLSSGAAWARSYPRPVIPPSAPARTATPRRFSEREQQAIACLVGLGAVLSEDFTVEALRREFRRLALRLHPDRHMGQPPAAIARAADEFARATDACRCLQRAIEPRH